MKYLRVTQVLTIAGCSDFSFVTDEGKWRGSTVHKAVEFSNKGTLDRRTVPSEIEGYFRAFEKFKAECRFVPQHPEHELKSKELHIKGRMDSAGRMKGKPGLFDFKTGEIRPATGLQLCLYGHMYSPAEWFERIGVQLYPTGQYKLKVWPISTWQSDLSTALSAVRMAHWKLANGLASV